MSRASTEFDEKLFGRRALSPPTETPRGAVTNNVVKLTRRVAIIPQNQANAQARLEAAKLVKLVAGRRYGDSVKVSIARAAVALGWSYSRTEDIWRREARIIHSHEMDMLRSYRKCAAAQR